MLDADTSEPTDSLTESAVAFCQRVGSKATTVSEIVDTKDEAVYRAIEQGIQRVNSKAAARPYCIQKWAILQRDFSISGGELGRALFFLLVCSHYRGGRVGRQGPQQTGRKQPGQAESHRRPPPPGGRTRSCGAGSRLGRVCHMH